MLIYLGNTEIGQISPSSIYDLKGSSFVHFDKVYRNELGLTNYDEFFDTMRDAFIWLMNLLPDASVLGCQYDINDGSCKTIHDLI